MERVAQIQELLLRSRRLPWLVIGLTVLVLGATILAGRQQLRDQMRGQLRERDGEILYAVALMHVQELENDPETELLGGMNSAENLLTVLLKTSRLKGVLAARLFGPDGRFLEAFPADALETQLATNRVSQLKLWQPVSDFLPDGRLSDVFFTAQAGAQTDKAVPLLEVNVPLHTRQKDRLLGIGQFVIEGESLAAQFARLDRNLTVQALSAFAVSGALLVASLLWGFRRLRQSHRLLEDRTHSLLQANQELALAAKTSAMGAITSHLVHGLKSPLSGLQSFVNNLDPSRNGATAPNWEEASAITRRMQTLINQVVSVLREEQGFKQYELSLADLNSIVTTRMEPLARQKGVQFTSTFGERETALPNRTANLVTLILMNLVQNAIEATSCGRKASLSTVRSGEQLGFEVRDEGNGLAESVKAQLFSPCHSSKEHGTGIGLAISKQLANHLGATLELKSSGPEGCVFFLALPATVNGNEAPQRE
jgi:signal transduction histidine kinase